MQDSELPVRVDSVFALRSFIEACKGGVLPSFCICIFNIFFYMINVVYAYFVMMYGCRFE